MILQKNLLGTAFITFGFSFETKTRKEKKKSYFYKVEDMYFSFEQEQT